jgi:hypothetical protein
MAFGNGIIWTKPEVHQKRVRARRTSES